MNSCILCLMFLEPECNPLKSSTRYVADNDYKDNECDDRSPITQKIYICYHPPIIVV